MFHRTIAVCLVLWAGFPACAATLVSGTLAGASRWTAAGSPYQLVGDVTIPAGSSLTVDPGVRVESPGPYTLTILGSLVSTAGGNRITFTSTTPTPGSWGGVLLATGATATVSGTDFMFAGTNLALDGAQGTFTNCRFSYGAQDGVVVYNQARFTAQGCTFAHNGRRGLYIETVHPQGSLTDCAFNYNGEYPIFLKANCVDMLGSGLTFLKNAYAQIAVSTSASQDVRRSQTWRSQPLPLSLAAETAAELTIPAGVTLTVTAPLTIIGTRLDVAGTLICGQSGADRVSLTGPTAVAGSWAGVRLLPGGSAELRNTTVRFAATGVSVESGSLLAGGSYFSSCQEHGLALSGTSQLTATGCRLEQNGRYGLRMVGTIAGSLSQTKFLSNAGYPVFAEARNVQVLRGGNTYWANGSQSIGVACGADPDLPTSVAWASQGIPLDLTARPSDTTLSIGPGATLTLPVGACLLGGGVDVCGTLDAQGGANRPIEFLPAAGTTPGAWLGITFHPGSGGTLRNCTIDRAETGVALLSASPTISYCTIRRSRSAAIACQGTAAPVVTWCVLSDNQSDGILVTDTARPNLGNLTNASTADDGRNVLRGNGGYDINNRSSRILYAQNNWWETGDAAAIGARIFDGRDQAGYGNVTFSPFLWPPGRVAPVLSWTGQPGYVGTGVSPASGLPQALYDFRVTYASAENRPARYVRLYLSHAGSPYPGSPFALELRSGTDAQSGLVYGYSLRLPAGRAYSYRFEAADALLPATGVATESQTGPVVNTAPTLSWAGGTNYATAGVFPTTGTGGGTFIFRVRYKDANGDAPSQVALHLEKDGTPLAGSPFAMGWKSGTMSGGAVYELALNLATGSYRYRFAADDGLAAATGAPTAWKTGPQVGAGAGALLTSVAAVPAPAGRVEIRCRLAQAATVTVTVRNAAGRPVGTVVADLPCEVGERVLLWNRRGYSGTLLPPGTYLLEITARAPDGTAARRVLPLSIL